MTTRFLVFLFDFTILENDYRISSEHKPLFMKKHVCFMKGHVWRVRYFFHKMVNNDWNLFNLSKQSPENSIENSRKFKILNFLLENSRSWIFYFMKPYSPNSNIIITTYPCIYLYIQHWINNFVQIYIPYDENISWLEGLLLV